MKKARLMRAFFKNIGRLRKSQRPQPVQPQDQARCSRLGLMMLGQQVLVLVQKLVALVGAVQSRPQMQPFRPLQRLQRRQVFSCSAYKLSSNE